MAELSLTPLPPEEAIKFFRNKGYTIGFNYFEVAAEEHARAFTVAKVTRYDILQDIRRAVDDALANGTTLRQFQNELEPLLKAKGWWGIKDAINPKTGEVVAAQLGSPRRLRTIYDTNLRMARAAGNWEKIQRLKDRRPFLAYSAVLDGVTRPLHRAWHGTVLPVDHVWWDTHYAPNGWHCRCRTIQYSQDDLDTLGLSVTPAPPVVKIREMRDKRSGRVERVPLGIDAGFQYNVGKFHMRGLSTPELARPLKYPAINPAASLTMPTPLHNVAGRVLATDISADQAVDTFLEQFGTVRGKAVVFADKIGEPLVISEAMFLARDGRVKLSQTSRRKSVALIADTIKDPDEIWWYWEKIEKTGSFELRRRYLKRYLDDNGKQVNALAVFDISKNGWVTLTGFTPRDITNLTKNRRGTLAYRRIEKPDT